MIIYIKKYFKHTDPCIDKWDEPREREFNGAMVKGRPTKGFGSSSFDYAGKLYKPTPWNHNMYQIKQEAESLPFVYVVTTVQTAKVYLITRTPYRH